MSDVELLRIDPEACKRDGLCVSVCPLGLVIQPDPDAVPVPVNEKADRCIACGHCAAVCPAGALELSAVAMAGFEPVHRELAISAEQAEQFMKSRRSVRRYKAEPVPDELLARVVDVSRWAPSGHNAHPVRWSVIRSRAGVVRVAEAIAAWMAKEAEADTDLARRLHLGGVARAYFGGADLVTRNAPHLATAWAPRQGVTPQIDAVIAGTHADLAAHALGLGACWCGYAMLAAGHSPDVLAALGVPEGNQAGACLMLGRPALRYKLIPARKAADITWME